MPRCTSCAYLHLYNSQFGQIIDHPLVDPSGKPLIGPLNAYAALRMGNKNEPGVEGGALLNAHNYGWYSLVCSSSQAVKCN